MLTPKSTSSQLKLVSFWRGLGTLACARFLFQCTEHGHVMTLSYFVPAYGLAWLAYLVFVTYHQIESPFLEGWKRWLKLEVSLSSPADSRPTGVMESRQEQVLLRRAADSEARFQRVIEAKHSSLCEKQSQLEMQVAAAEEALRRDKEVALELQTEVSLERWELQQTAKSLPTLWPEVEENSAAVQSAHAKVLQIRQEGTRALTRWEAALRDCQQPVRVLYRGLWHPLGHGNREDGRLHCHWVRKLGPSRWRTLDAKSLQMTFGLRLRPLVVSKAEAASPWTTALMNQMS